MEVRYKREAPLQHPMTRSRPPALRNRFEEEDICNQSYDIEDHDSTLTTWYRRVKRKLQLVMSLRAPRRRISPRTKRRYRAIRNFLRRALGTASQPDDNKTNSNISVSVLELKYKIVGIEKQLDQVSQHCRDLISVNDDSTCEKSLRTQQNSVNSIRLEKNVSSTKLLYKTSENQLKSFIASDVTSKVSDVYCVDVGKQQQKSKKETKIDNYRVKHKRKIRKFSNELPAANQNDSDQDRLKQSKAYEPTMPSPLTTSYCSTVEKKGHSSHRHENRQRKKLETSRTVDKKISHKTREDPNTNHIEHLIRSYDKRNRYRKERQDIDKKFIADIITRQYKPVKLFNRNNSAMSQLSVPLCRDQDFSVHENIHEGSELCSCCFDEPAIPNESSYICNFSDVRSVYNTKLYNNKRYSRYRQNRNNQEYYNDSFYDLIPVKEKSSPKTPKKFSVYNMIPYDHYKEVPPSPRSLRPRLNLKAQHYEAFDDLVPNMSQTRGNYLLDQRKVQKFDKNVQNSDISNFITAKKDETILQTAPIIEIPNNDDVNSICPDLLQPTFGNNQTNLTINNVSLDKTGEVGINVDRTDKTLYEIKDILQSFLEEMKRETAQSDKSEISNKSVVKLKSQNENKKNLMKPNSLHTYRQSNVSGQCAANCMCSFPNNCCYPLLPICPVNCIQNGFPPVVLPTPSNTCTACINHRKESAVQARCETECSDNTKDKIPGNNTKQLIEEIYNYVKKSPILKEDTKYRDVYVDNSSAPEMKFLPNKELTSRSAGASSNLSLHDVIVGTSQMKCYSKSCEALSPQEADDTYSTKSFSDTVLEKLSLEAAATQPSDLDFSSILDVKVKPTRKNKLAKVLKTFGSLLKKRKKDVIEELSESESHDTEEGEMRQPSPYRQQMTNYMMHGEEYFRQAPLFPRRGYPPRSPEYSYHHPVGIDSRHGYPYSPLKRPHEVYPPMTGEQTIHYGSQYPGTSPSYSASFDPRYNPAQPQVPLCLKEVEVKSMGTQSEKKKSFLEVLKQSMAGAKQQIDPVEEAKKNVEKITKRTGLLNWKNFNEKTMEKNAGNLNLTYKFTQQHLAETDMTIRNAMIKRFFHKRNPFSSRNPILQTLLGKDKPMEEPMNLLQARMIV